MLRVSSVDGVGDLSLLEIGRLRVLLSGVRSFGGLSPEIPSLPVAVGGTWGTPAPPVIVSASAVNGVGGGPGLDSGDAVVLVFDQEVATPVNM